MFSLVVFLFLNWANVCCAFNQTTEQATALPSKAWQTLTYLVVTEANVWWQNHSWPKYPSSCPGGVLPPTTSGMVAYAVEICFGVGSTASEKLTCDESLLCSWSQFQSTDCSGPSQPTPDKGWEVTANGECNQFQNQIRPNWYTAELTSDNPQHRMRLPITYTYPVEGCNGTPHIIFEEGECRTGDGHSGITKECVKNSRPGAVWPWDEQQCKCSDSACESCWYCHQRYQLVSECIDQKDAKTSSKRSCVYL